MVPAWYRDIPAAEIPRWVAPGVDVAVIAGHAGQGASRVVGAMQREHTEPVYLDIHLEPGARFEQPLPAGHHAFVYIYRGQAQVGDTLVPTQRMAILAQDDAADGISLRAGNEPTRALLIAGQPLREPIAQYGPFVMNTQEQIFQAVEDFRAGRLG
jgi:redox-sensitive bicupin YhaK (pirin superfamily)